MKGTDAEMIDGLLTWCPEMAWYLQRVTFIRNGAKTLFILIAVILCIIKMKLGPTSIISTVSTFVASHYNVSECSCRITSILHYPVLPLKRL